MVENSSSGLSLFSLLARDWTLEDEVTETVFNHDDTGVLFRSRSGKLALASTKDAESPKIRTRMDLETGRTTIRPRENAVSPLRIAEVTAHTDLPATRFGTQGFAVVDLDGAVQQVTGGGNVVLRLKPDSTGVTSLCSSVSGNVLALARQGRIVLYDTDDMQVQAEIGLDHPVTCQAYSADAQALAAWGGNTLSVIDVQSPTAAPQVFECGGNITEISWRKSGSHLSCASADNSFYVINRTTGTAQRVEDFPTPVRNTAFSETGNALVASGAFRLVGWDCSDLPENDLPGTPLTTGKAGFVAISVIAAHPERSLVASGYANGLVTIASIGTSQEMMLHHENATEVSSICWSKTGEHLAIGYTSGKVAIVTFPAQMFK
ncbi:WD40 repeat domain-containing protein [Ruegeria hyattellae]|uniref:WD40 repeat domain-containing protein n=1 Tax=Ruegeria hyattellae TaxID=3233337 RepID=UPI00355B94BE